MCAWILEALRRDFDVTLLTWTPVDWAEVNRFYGTTLGPGDVRVHLAYPRLPAAARNPAPTSSSY